MFLVILLLHLCQRVSDLMSEGGQILTLSYLGAERAMPHYNVMGIAKSAFRDKC